MWTELLPFRLTISFNLFRNSIIENKQFFLMLNTYLIKKTSVVVYML